MDDFIQTETLCGQECSLPIFNRPFLMKRVRISFRKQRYAGKYFGLRKMSSELYAESSWIRKKKSIIDLPFCLKIAMKIDHFSNFQKKGIKYFLCKFEYFMSRERFLFLKTSSNLFLFLRGFASSLRYLLLSESERSSRLEKNFVDKIRRKKWRLNCEKFLWWGRGGWILWIISS